MKRCSTTGAPGDRTGHPRPDYSQLVVERRRGDSARAYKDVGEVVDAADQADLSKNVARLEPLTCIKG